MQRLRWQAFGQTCSGAEHQFVSDIQRSTRNKGILEIVEISYLKLVCVRVRQRAVDCDVRYACASLPDASRIRHCVICWGLGRRGR
jgi:hypothetical protein